MIRKTTLFILSFFLLVPGSFAAENFQEAFSEGTFYGQIRTLYFERDFDERTDREDLAVGGNAYYRTAPLYGINAGMAFYTGQDMNVNDDDKNVYGLLAKDEDGDHDSFSVLGEAFIQLERWHSSLKIGRQELETPWINTDDNRLTPQSTASYYLTNNSIKDLEIIAGHVTRMRGKAATEFDSMSEYAGITGEKKPVSLAGLIYSGFEGFNFQFWDYYAHDYFNNIYFKAGYAHEISDGLSGFLTYQHLVQKDAGDKIGGEIDTFMYTFESGLEIKGLTLALAYGRIGDDDLNYPWGHDLIISGQLNDLARADETGYLAKIAYDFSEIGLTGISAKVLYMDFNTPEHGTNASPDYDDIDLDVTYKFSGVLEGLKLRLRHAIINEDEGRGGEDYTDSRIYLTYDFKI